MQIKNVFLYSVPYTEDDHHQPLNSLLPDSWEPIKEFYGINSHLFNFGSSIELTAFYEEVKDANYAKFSILMNSDKTHEEPWEITYYAWIDRFDPKSQQYFGSIKIFYHWDYWRTFKENVTVLRGTIISRTPTKMDPPQYVPFITETCDNTIHYIIGQQSEIVWIYLTTVDTSSKTGIQRIAFPVSSESYIKNFEMNYYGKEEYYKTPTFKDVMDGTLLKDMGIEQNKLVGCSVSSVAPVDYKFDGTKEPPLITVTYISSGFYDTISTDDIIEEYGGICITYNNIHMIDLNRFYELPFTHQLVSFDRVSGKEELKWWYFSTISRTIVYNRLYSAFEFVVNFIVPDKDEQYFPFLIYLKYYSTYYDMHSLRLIFSLTEPEVFYGSYEWTYSSPLFRAPYFTQIFNIDKSRHIIEIEKTSSDTFTIKFNNGDLIENVGIDKILVKRKVGNNKFTFRVVLDDKKSIESVLYNSKIVLNNIDGTWFTRHYTFENSLSSTPLNNLYLVDNAGYPITKFQQGRDLFSYSVQAISQNNEMFILFRFNKGGYIENFEYVVNMTPIDLTQEYFNEYILSGEREAANARRSENIISSIVNLAASASIGTLIAGPGGGVIGAGKALGKTLISGLATTGLVGTALNQYQQSELESRLQNRGSFLIRSGNDYSWISNGDLIKIVKTKYDDYSVIQYNNKVYEYGINCNEIDIDGNQINLLLNTEGPIKLSSVTLSEGIPYEANIYIRQKLLNGVFLDTNLSRIPNINNVK